MGDARIGSLFTGYGGLEAAVQAVLGGTVAWHCDNDTAAGALLAHHYPDVPNLGDITAVDWGQVQPVDILTAGYPCQPFSAAGKRLGVDDDRYLWPEVARAIRALGPPLVVLENVSAHVVRGFPRVVGDLADLGYDARWTVVRASDVGSCHGRARLFAIAETTDRSVGDEWRVTAPGQASGRRAWPDAGRRDRAPAPYAAGTERRGSKSGHLAAGPAATAEPRERLGSTPRVVGWGRYAPAIRRWERILGRPAPVPYDLNTNGNPRLHPRMQEWMMGLPEGYITAVPGISRNDMHKLAGNGVCPQQGELALRRLLDVTDPPVVGVTGGSVGRPVAR